ncbi:TIGR02302 family protein [Martelella mediterranea]|uniref:Uncharacterized protein (TIGR02302 family) n=1 Tax=Martelella mediterranea TaxID=293089 RepID=A0A4R3NS41_9HYPH|nr:TIGR02302 family protein [Martelella mediterranea]TCT39084.1 uncharacterized protein (TIGR02302 family) [Martelella mediterranea]
MADRKKAGNRSPDAAMMRRIARKRGIVQLNLFLEALLPRLLWPACIAALFLSLSWLGVFYVLPFVLRGALGILLAISFAVSLHPLRHVRLPSRAAAERRLETLNALEHQAIGVRYDRPAGNGPEAMALWRAHQRRMAAKVRHLDSGNPFPDFSSVDPYGLRAVPVLLLFVAFLYAGASGSGRLADVFIPPEDDGDTALALRFDAWISPPAYTGKAPVYLKREMAEPVRDIPQGSVVTVRLSGRGADGDIRYQNDDGSALEPDMLTSGEMARSAEFTLDQSGVLSAADESWTITVAVDKAPTIAFKGTPKAAANGALELQYTVDDDYGVTEARAEIRPAGAIDPEAEPVYPMPSFPLNLPVRSSDDNSAMTSQNLTEHPLSGTPVTITLYAEDAAGHESQSEPLEMVMPSRSFFNLLAGAVAEQRQIFALDARNMPKAIDYSRAITLRPAETIADPTRFLLIKTAQTRMMLADDQESYRDTADYMWDIATGIEGGALSDAERRLREAQDALSRALEEGASDAEIARLMQELREAMQQYMSEMAAQMQDMPRNMSENAETLRQHDLDNMLNQLENLARSGDRAAAQQLLSELQRMMNNIQPPSSFAQNQSGQQNSEMRQQVDKLGELIQEQQRLMNETFEYDQQLRDREQWGDPIPQEGENQQSDQGGDKAPRDMTAEELRDALKQLQDRQQSLSDELKQLQQKLSELGMPPAEGFGKAGEAMDGAADSLGEGEGSAAVDGQGQALEALRQGAQQMMNSLMAQEGQGQGQGRGPNGQMGWGNQAGRDPLGRNPGSDGLDFGENVDIPDDITVQRAREILDAIRERLNQGAAPLPEEKPYLERLLDPQSQN